MSLNSGGCGHLHLIKDHHDCKYCQGEKLCLAFGLDPSTVDAFKNIIKEHGPYSPGEYIYRQQDKFKAIYSIQDGSVKTETVTVDGKQSVMGFFLAGDLFGIDSIGSPTCATDAIAMEKTWVCEIPYKELLKLCSTEEKLQQQFINRLGSKIHSGEYNWKIVRNESAGRRVMYFLFQLYDRQRRNNSPSPRVRLPMSKQDLASFLGLTPESFSRTLTQLHNEGLITKESSKVIVLEELPTDDDIQHLILPDIR